MFHFFRFKHNLGSFQKDMGLYSGDKIYGVKFLLEDAILFEKTSLSPLIGDEIKEIKTFYDGLSNESVVIRFYCSCSTSYTSSPNHFMSWFPGDKEILNRLFSQ